MENITFLKKLPEEVVIPLVQHKGPTCKCLVSKGDTVLAGQVIGEPTVSSAAPVHASVSGTVSAIEKRPHPFGTKTSSVIITVDETQQSVEFNPPGSPSKTQIRKIIKDAGIVEIYGRPTYNVIEKIDTIILNATYESSLIAGCVGISTYPNEVNKGLKYLMEAAGAKKAYIAVNKNNKEDLNSLSGLKLDSTMEVVQLNIEYTPGMENLLVYDVAGFSAQFGGNPEDVGVGVCGVNTAYEVYDAVTSGRPSMRVPVSVVGAVGGPQSILVPIGMKFKDVIEACGGYKGESGKLIMNGMTIGLAQYTDEVPVVKQTAGILVQTPSEVLRIDPVECTLCARCVDVCPVELLPTRLAIMADQGKFEECRMMHIMNCVECGKCAVGCPSKIPILQLIRYGKLAIEKAYADIEDKESPNVEIGEPPAIKIGGESKGGV
jgi:electron transport complex protein RnfC